MERSLPIFVSTATRRRRVTPGVALALAVVLAVVLRTML
jgi:hypothetical protein